MPRKEIEVTKEQQGVLKAHFRGYIFRRKTEDGRYFVKASTRKEEEGVEAWLDSQK